MSEDPPKLTHDQVMARHLTVLKRWEATLVQEIASKQQGLAVLRMEIQKLERQGRV